MKLPLIPVLFALIVPLAACNNNKPTISSEVQSPAPQSSAVPQTNTASVPPNWYNYTAQDGSYRVNFPGQPQQDNQSVDTQIGKIQFVQALYEDKTQQQLYYAANAKYPVDPSKYDVEKGLDGARDNAAKGGNFTIANEEKINLNGLPGREVTMRGQQGELKARYFIDPKGPILYQVFVLAPDGSLQPSETQAFLDSLAIAQ